MDKYIPIILLVCLIFSVSGFLNPLFAYVMSSGNGYRIQHNTPLNVSGGGLATSSSNYTSIGVAGTSAGGISNSDLYKILAGYQQMQEVALSVGSPGDQTLTPDIYGISGGVANASAVWNMMTDNEAGFSAKISASTVPAMKLVGDGTYYLDDYPPAVAGIPDYVWGVTSENAAFGFTVEPATPEDTASNFLDNGSSCNTGSENHGDSCWLGANGTTAINIINRPDRTSAAGENETIKFRAEVNNKFLKSGTYTAQVTITVSAN